MKVSSQKFRIIMGAAFAACQLLVAFNAVEAGSCFCIRSCNADCGTRSSSCCGCGTNSSQCKCCAAGQTCNSSGGAKVVDGTATCTDAG